MAKLQDIAARTGFSVSTVSKALRGLREIGPETRQKITLAAKELGYAEKSGRRRYHAEGNAGTVGVIGLEIKSSYHAQIIGALESAMQRHGYSMLLGLSNFEYESETALLERFTRQGICGIICITGSEKIDYDLRSYRAKHDIPVVLLASVIAIEDFDYVKRNEQFGPQLAVRHLLDLGHTSIGFVGDILSNERMRVFEETLANAGFPPLKEHLCIGTDRFERGGYLRMKELLDHSPRPTAILASYDDVAIGAMRTIDEAGLSVPEDISVVGIDGIEVGAFLPTSLTTVLSHTEEMADAAAKMLFRKIEDPTFTIVQHLEFNPELVVRESTAPPRQSV